HLPRERLAFMIKDANTSILLNNQRFHPLLPDGKSPLPLLDAYWNEIERENSQNLPNQTAAQNRAYVMYTSGSTGNPKAVMGTRRGLVNYLNWSATAYGAGSAKASPVHSPLGFDLTVTSLFIPLLTGQAAVLVPEADGIEGLSSLLAS